MSEKTIVAALDVGGAKIAAAAVDEDGKILHRTRYANEGGGAFVLDVCGRAVRGLMERFDISAVGISTVGHVEPAAGRIEFAVNIEGYAGVAMGDEMRERTGLPAAVGNDGRMALFGERWKGAAQGCGDIFGVVLGTGVGGGYVTGGVPVYGAGYAAGEIGHSILYPGGYPCPCGQNGCAEQYISGSALWKNYNRRAGAHLISSGHDFFKLLEEGGGTARDVLADFVSDLASCAVSIANILAPEAIIFGGGLMDTSDRWWESFKESYLKQGNPRVRVTRLVKAALGNDAALIGAAWSALGKLGVIG
ncbi:MAG: ROK family protein [Synergistaceae bacterium]|jgi:glucokinase|nr:ROK family protein [Synergistaceae bacterium]